MNIPGFTLLRQNETLKDEFINVLSSTIDKGNFILGESVKSLEKAIANYCGAKYGIGVANGSDALYLSLIACGVDQQAEVITTPFTFFATAGAIVRVGAKPVFVDIDPVTLNIDPKLIEEKITPKTKAIIPVQFMDVRLTWNH